MIEYENLRRVNAPFFPDYERELRSILESGWFVLGAAVTRFEKEFAAYVSCNHCTGVASGLDALTLALRAFEFEDGGEVIVPSNTYIATILSILHNRLQPVLVEPDAKTYNIDPGLIERRLTPKTRAVVVVHLYGKPCDMDPIVSLCRKHGLRLIEDCAQSHGAIYKGQMTGTFGDFGCFSFYPTKNLGALGDAGAIVTDDEALADRIRVLRNYGSRIKYYNETVGFNSRLDELQAAFLSVKLKHLGEVTAHKRMLAALYDELISDRFIKPIVEPHSTDVYHIYNIRHQSRDRLRAHLLDKGIKTEIHYPVSPNRQEAMKGIIDHEPCPISEEIHATTLSLPISSFHTAEDVREVAQAVNSY
jgi:dTDP-4-amino-4,6-dideoxygalactose transaminase